MGLQTPPPPNPILFPVVPRWLDWTDFGTPGSMTKDTLRSRPGFLLFFGGFCCPWVSFGMLGASTLPSWGTQGRSWDDPRTLGSTRQDTVRSRLGFYRFFVDLGEPSRELFGYIWIKEENLFISISRLLFLIILGTESECVELEKQEFRKGAKNQLLQKLDFSCFHGQIFMILGGLGTNFHDFCCTGDWNEI